MLELSAGRKDGMNHTFAEERDLLDGRSILEEVQVHEGDLLATGILHNGLDASVVNLGESDLKASGAGLDVDRRGTGSLEQGQKSSGGNELHDELDG
jgi:hypothetical protein